MSDKRPTHEERTAAIRTVVDTLRKVTAGRADNIRVIANVGAYLLLFDDDLAYFMEDLRQAPDAARRVFVAKHLATLLYEASEDLPQMLGKEFRAAVQVLELPSDLMTRLGVIASGLHRYWEKHRGFLGDVRRFAGAHREHDALAYLAALEMIEPLDVAQRAAEFSEHFRALAVLVTDMHNALTEWAMMLDAARGLDAAAAEHSK